MKTIPLKTWIVIHVCYREIFNAPVCLQELKAWLGIKENNVIDFLDAKSSLVKEGLLVEENGYIVRRGNEGYIEEQPRKNEAATKLIQKGSPLLNLLGKISLIKFIGISGSVAANNPTPDKEGFNQGNIDLDIYLVTMDHSLWLLFLLERILSNLSLLLTKKHFYCFNYVTEESFLEITNKSFFTATEFINLKPLNSQSKSNILVQNLWVGKYYYVENDIDKHLVERGFFTPVRKVFNVTFFLVYFLMRALKRRKIKVLSWLRFDFDSSFRHNYRRISSPNGGYEISVAKKFTRLFKSGYPEYASDSVIQYLFPSYIYEKKIDKEKGIELDKRAFEKYAVE